MPITTFCCPLSFDHRNAQSNVISCIEKMWGAYPQSIVVHHNQSELVPLVNLMLCSDKHLNHLLGYVQGVGFRPNTTTFQFPSSANTPPKRCIFSWIMYCNMWASKKTYPLNDSSFCNDISSERSRQMIYPKGQKVSDVFMSYWNRFQWHFYYILQAVIQ